MKYLFISFLALLFMVSCGHHHHTHDAHEDTSSSIYLEALTPDYEFFADATPLSKGNLSEFTVHITKLTDYKPLASALLNIWWVSNGENQRLFEGLQLSNGIATFEFSPEKIGSGILKIEVISELIVGTTEHELEVFETPEQAIIAAKSAEPDQTNAIGFTKQQAWKIDFRVGRPSSDHFGLVVRSAATIEASPQDRKMLSASISGMVSFSDRYPAIGVTYEKGQPIMTISSDQLVSNNLRLQFEEARLGLEKADADYQRASKLAADQIVSEKELQQLRLMYEQTKKHFENLQKNAANGRQVLLSPGKGHIQQLLVQNGQYVEAGSPLAIVSGGNRLLLTMGLAPKYLPLLNEQISGVVISNDNRYSYQLSDLEAKVSAIGQSLAAGSALLPLSIEAKSAPGLIPGSLAHVLLRFPSNDSVLLIPNEAIIEEHGLYFIFVQLHPELFEKREIKKGETDGLHTVVLAGIEANERIVTKGAITIKLAQSTGELDPHAGHNH